MKMILFCFLLGNQLTACIDDHLRKVENKSDHHHIRNIDFIYMINLDERPEKWASSMRQLEPYGITPYRFSAINGWKLEQGVIDDVGLKFDSTMSSGALGTVYRSCGGKIYKSNELIQEVGTTYFCHLLSRGAIAIVLSHLSVLQDAYDSGYQTIWVMEDDVEVLSDPGEIPELIDKLDVLLPNWDVIFTDRELRGDQGELIPCQGIYPKPNFELQPFQYYLQRTKLSEDFTQVRSRYGAHSMIVRRSGMKKILDFIKTYKIYLPYDIDYCYPPGITLVSCNRNIVSNLPGAITDNRIPNNH